MGEAPESIRLVETSTTPTALEVADPEQVAYLTQTTLAVDETAEVVDALRERFPALAGPPSRDDICYATQNRQQAVQRRRRTTATSCSSSARRTRPTRVRLVEVAEKEGTPARLIDDRRRSRPRVAGRQAYDRRSPPARPRPSGSSTS